MGALGLTAYLMIIVQGFRVCINQILKQEKSRNIEKNSIEENTILFVSFLAMLAGYAVYGLTNFDEITILLYFFVFLSMLRSLNPEGKKRELKIGIQFRIPLLVLSILVVIFMCYNMYNSVNNARADRYFLEGEKNFASRKYADGVNNLNESIRLYDSNPVYKLMLAINVYEMLASNKQVIGENRDNLLKQAAENIINAKKNHYNKNRCDAVLSLIYFEMGKKDEAESIKKQVLAGDPINIIYRLSLTVHYVEANDMNSAKEQLESVLSTNYSAMNVWSVAAFYYEKTNNPDEAKKYCLKILEADPQNQYAREFLNNHK
jgi:tetratricopeptide (TPR) repeat protein